MSSSRRQTRSGVDNAAPASRTKRINGRACIDCHRRKIKCDVVDKGTPCTNCEVHRRPGCCLYEKKRTRELRQHASPRVTRTIRPRESAPVDMDVDAPAATGVACPPNTRTPTPDDGDASDPGNLAEFIDHEEIRSAAIELEGRMCFIGTGVSNFNYLVRQSSLRPADENAFHFANRQFRRAHTAHDLQNVPPETLKRLNPALERRLLQAYFERVNRGWAIVDEEYFMAVYDAKGAQNGLSLVLLNAILIVGVHVLAEEDPKLKALQPVLFRRTKCLIDRRFEQDRTVYVQAALLLTWYSDGLEEILANAWHWIGVATRIALGHGMNRDVSMTSMPAVSKRIWARLWWTMVQFDTMVSAAYGRVPALDINESDVPELKASNFDGIPHADVDFVIQHSRLCCIISKAVRARWSLRATVDSQIETTREADEALGRFISQLPQQLQLSGPEMSPWKATLHLTYNNFLTLLHRPAPRNSLLDAAAEACSDMSICGVATTATASIFDTLRHRGLLLDLWLYDIHALLTAMIHVGCELKSSSPLVSARAQQTFESLMASLAVLARHWRFAQGLLNLFEQRARRRTATATSQQAPSESVPDMASSVSSTQTPGREWYGWNAVNSGQRNVYGGPDTPIGNNGGADMLAGTGKADRDGVGQPYDSNWGDGDLLVPGLPFPDASALEFFLADLGDGNQWTSL